MRKDTEAFLKWRERRQLLDDESEIRQSKKLNLNIITDDEFDRVNDTSFDDLSKIN